MLLPLPQSQWCVIECCVLGAAQTASVFVCWGWVCGWASTAAASDKASCGTAAIRCELCGVRSYAILFVMESAVHRCRTRRFPLRVKKRNFDECPSAITSTLRSSRKCCLAVRRFCRFFILPSFAVVCEFLSDGKFTCKILTNRKNRANENTNELYQCDPN